MKTLLLWLAAWISVFAMDPLVNAEWLKAHQHDKNIVIVDVSDVALFEKEHIPGSINSPIIHWRKKYQKHLLVKDADAIQKEFDRLGIDEKSSVVVYSHHESPKDILKASYIIWAMEHYGFDNTAMLDGGLPAWKESGGVLSIKETIVTKGSFKVSRTGALVADMILVKKEIGASQMIDARPAVFYFGAKKQPVLAKAGHIPKAKSYFWKYSFKGKFLKNKEVLKAMLIDGLGLDPKKPTITYCTGGLETSMNFFVLHRLLGFENIRLYDASMKEWANAAKTPMRKYIWE